MLARPSLIGAARPSALLAQRRPLRVFTTLSSVCIVMLYLAYLWSPCRCWSTGSRDWDRVGQHRRRRPLFSLGRWGMPVNVLAVVYGAVMVVNLAWPRAEVYDPSGENGILLWFAPLMVGIALLLGIWVRRSVPGQPAAPRLSPTPHPAALTIHDRHRPPPGST